MIVRPPAEHPRRYAAFSACLRRTSGIIPRAPTPARFARKRENARFAGVSDAGGGTRTPDTRIMIPHHFGSATRRAGGGGHKRGHNRGRHAEAVPRSPRKGGSRPRV